MANLTHSLAYYKEFSLDYIQTLVCQKESALDLSGVITGPTRMCNGEGFRVTEFDKLNKDTNTVGIKRSDYANAGEIKPAGVSTTKKGYKTKWDAFRTRASVSKFSLADHGIPEDVIMGMADRLQELVYAWMDNRFFSEAPHGLNFKPDYHGRDEPAAAPTNGDMVIDNTDPTDVKFDDSGQVRTWVTSVNYVSGTGSSAKVVPSTPSLSWSRTLPGIAANVVYDANSKFAYETTPQPLNEAQIVKATRMLGRAFVSGELRRGMKILITNFAHGTNWRDTGKHQLSSDFNSLLGTGLHESIAFNGGELSRVGNLYILSLINAELPQYKGLANRIMDDFTASNATAHTVQCSFLTYTNNLSLVVSDSPVILPKMGMDVTEIVEDAEFDIRVAGACGVNYRSMGAVVPIYHSVL